MKPAAPRARPQLAGSSAEDGAARFLERHGLRILARNYRTRQGEIDLIAQDGEVLVFVEVRLRSGSAFGGALASITRGKQARIVAAARHFLMRLGREPPCRFDVIGIDEGEPTWLRSAFDAA